MDKNSIEIYIHIPFCVKKCDYCDFLSFSCSDDIKDRYIKALQKEILLESRKYAGCQVSSVFIGGGTPSSLPCGQIRELVDALSKSFVILDDAEITIECNPGTLSRDKLLEYKESGINRLSIGLQSADDKELRLLGRIHDYNTFLQNYRLARECGFDNINVDLISGLPGQHEEDFVATLQKVIELNPEHISAYGLIIEEGTPFIARYGEGCEEECELPSEDVERAIYHRTRELLMAAGYPQYEISNYAKPGYECQHNIGYWTRREYIGFGIGAASLYDNVRWNNIRDIQLYIDALEKEVLCTDGSEALSAIDETIKEDIEELSIAEQMEEYMFLGLRMCDGICLNGAGTGESDFEELFGISLYDIEDYRIHTKKMVDEGLLIQEDKRLRLTDKGMDLANYVMSGYC